MGDILYSLRGGVPSFTHCNRRGDVTAKTDATGTITYQSQYEAFGQRTTETGATLDPQKSNTKDEDIPGYANEGFRFRDLETGVFLSRDPAGFVDGPNLYTYVKQNPWTGFDPQGLFVQLIVPVLICGATGSEIAVGTWSGAAMLTATTGAIGVGLGLIPPKLEVAPPGQQIVADTKNPGSVSCNNPEVQKGTAYPEGTTLEQQQQHQQDRDNGSASTDANLNNSLAENETNSVGDLSGKKTSGGDKPGGQTAKDVSRGEKSSEGESGLENRGVKIPGGRKINDTLPKGPTEIKNAQGDTFKEVHTPPSRSHGGMDYHTHPNYRNNLPDGTTRSGVSKHANPINRKDIIDATRPNAQRTGGN